MTVIFSQSFICDNDIYGVKNIVMGVIWHSVPVDLLKMSDKLMNCGIGVEVL